MQSEEVKKLQGYLCRTFDNNGLKVKARPNKGDSAEVYLADEYLGIIFKDEEDGELAYNFQMAILDFDLEELD